jgi:nucleotidyltransferase/DNA polymerase involved in DNA repair
MKERYIVHVDMDAFFAAIEQRDNPLLRGKPVIVGADPDHGKGRGVVSTCSYEARSFGIHSAMPISIAYKRCPRGIYLRTDMKRYSIESEHIYEIFYDFSPNIEPVGIDEAFIDITGSFHLFGTPRDTCFKIKEKIKSETGLTASIGLAPIKMAAKIASDLKKPDGFVEVTADGLLDFLWPLKLEKLWGVGKVSGKIFNQMGIYTIGDLAGSDPNIIAERTGKGGLHLRELANGIDSREVEASSEAKSVSNEVTFEKDTNDYERLVSALMALSEKVSTRLRGDFLRGRTISVKIRISGFKTYTRAITVEHATNFTDEIYKHAKQLFDGFYTGKQKIRLVGVKVSKLESSWTRSYLFENKENSKKETLHNAVSAINRRFGDRFIWRARGQV